MTTIYKFAYKVAVIGLDGAGKTTMINSIKNLPVIILHPLIFQQTECEITPTIGFQMEIVNPQNLDKPVLIYDCSGQARHRINWRIFYPEVQCVIFVIDSTDKNRMYNVDKLIKELLLEPVLEKNKVPLVFFANKQDDDDA